MVFDLPRDYIVEAFRSPSVKIRVMLEMRIKSSPPKPVCKFTGKTGVWIATSFLSRNQFVVAMTRRSELNMRL